MVMVKKTAFGCIAMVGIFVLHLVHVYLFSTYLRSNRLSHHVTHFNTELRPSEETAPVSFTMQGKRDHQEHRLNVIREYCQRKIQPSQSQDKVLLFPHPDVIASPGIKLTVCQSSKAGSTFWRYFVNTIYHGTFLRKMESSFLPSVISNNFTKVILVRHPLHRIYSVYNDKVVRMTGHHYIMRGVSQAFNNFVYHRFNDSCVNDFSFADYIRLATKEVLSGVKNWDLHRMPHFRYCKPCEFQYDFVLNLETFISDSKELVAYLQKRGIKVMLDTRMFDSNYLFDKCRYFTSSRLAGWPYASHPCSTDNAVLTANLEGLHNQGFVSAFGFTKKAFQDLPVASWKDKCRELVARVMKDPEKRKLASSLAKEAVKRAIRALPKIYLDEFIKAYLPDFEMFDYKTDI